MRTLVALIALAVAAHAHAAAPRVVSGLKTPESVISTPDGRIVVSQIGEFGRAGDGQVSLIDPKTGTVTPLATGLHDPKGLAFRAGHVYVTDRTRIVRIDKAGKSEVWVDAAAFPQPPQFLNDVEFDGAGDLYVSDSGDLEKGHGGAIFRVTARKKVELVSSEATEPQLRSPNGLLADGAGRMLVVDFATGQLSRLDTKTGKLSKLGDGYGGGDGLVRTRGGQIIASDWKGGRVMHVDVRKPGAAPVEYATKFQASADIGLDPTGRFVLVPDMKAGTLTWLPCDCK